ncbi:diguanylate cyclase domain-containing protein [Acetonema longum]|uniref:Diguanylate cyclase with PAS/PAC sensor n=1 Tax=Acetonema longum DSM 6540 TaxID=1009370 RepID=F7NIZ6_9FIRM|nr:diguanylate cyclase [Acetonema longum]EGO63993.1 diguanylate cyclase with PAS/PAC sensor [Acetonema longum DSM 6540]
MLAIEQFQTMQSAYMAQSSLVESLICGIALTTLLIIVLLIHSKRRQAVQIGQDLTDGKKTDQLRQQEEIKLRGILAAIPDQIVRFSSEGDCLEVMAAPAKELHGLSVEEIYPPDIAQLYRQGIQALRDSGHPQIFEYRLKTGATVSDCEARLVASAEDEILAIVRDVTERKKIEDQFHYLSLHDSLTGLYNRAYFQQEMRRLAGGRQLPVGIVVCDVDGLKLINDTLGHEHGDTLIIAVARILTECFRDSDVVARIGGDEFAILLPRISSSVLERICRRIQDREAVYNKLNPSIPLGLSVGYAISDVDAVDMNNLFQQADNAMYRHKLMDGRDTRTAMVKGMLQALERCDFFDYDHAHRLQLFIGMIGERLQLRKSQRRNLNLLAQFHDIGKVGIATEIIYKSAPLTTEEFQEICRHCEIGYRITRFIPELAGIADWVLKHHEFWNGSGYPLGLKGEAIPLESRILAVADAYEVMTADRPYRQALTKQQAIAELKAQAGIQFDPKLVEVFVAMVEEIDPQGGK